MTASGTAGPAGASGTSDTPGSSGTSGGGAQRIRPNSVLPATRTPLRLHTDDGLELVGELAVPVDRAPVATLVCLHPQPLQGGMMDSHVLRKAALRLPALLGFAVLRFNTRGTASADGTSGGSYDDGRAEGVDVAAAVAATAEHGLPAPWLVGWSFGTKLAVLHGLAPADPAVLGAVLLSPPDYPEVREALPRWAADGRPLTAVVPEFDDFLRPDAAREMFAAVPQARLVAVAGARHLWVGSAERALAEVAAAVLPARLAPDGTAEPVPTTWDGPMSTAAPRIG